MNSILRDKTNVPGRILILDGAVGSLLQQRGLESHPILWTALANITSPEKVKNLHIDYIRAGADIITTNTFRTNPSVVKKSGISINNRLLVKKSVAIAANLRNDFKILIAGSNAPAEDCYQKIRTVSNQKLQTNHKNHIEWLYSAGCDFILNETQSHLDEIEIISSFCSESEIPYVISFFFDENLNILSGQSVLEAINLALQYSPMAIGFNCISADGLGLLFSQLVIDCDWGFYLNCGAGDYNDTTLECGISPEKYNRNILQFLNFDPLFIGGCCGSDPSHIKNIRDLLNAKN